DRNVTGVQTCALPIWASGAKSAAGVSQGGRYSMPRPGRERSNSSFILQHLPDGSDQRIDLRFAVELGAAPEDAALHRQAGQDAPGLQFPAEQPRVHRAAGEKLVEEGLAGFQAKARQFA